ncbi:uncharacterized protein [Mytilus edulis]|uniref:uncharacterized protein n=1 Tax=Mytilus edulis TaxID=6550 RepID=UPI0039EF2E16
MGWKELFLLLFVNCLHSIVESADCSTQACLTRLYNSNVLSAEYFTRPLGSSSSGSSKPSSGSSSGGWFWRRRSSSRSSRWFGKRDWDYYLHHAGVVVTIDRYVVGRNRWLIHKGSNYGDKWDTVITDAQNMDSRTWTRTKSRGVGACKKIVNDFLRAARIHSDYRLTGPNCQTAANGMWNMIERYC